MSCSLTPIPRSSRAPSASLSAPLDAAARCGPAGVRPADGRGELYARRSATSPVPFAHSARRWAPSACRSAPRGSASASSTSPSTTRSPCDWTSGSFMSPARGARARASGRALLHLLRGDRPLPADEATRAGKSGHLPTMTIVHHAFRPVALQTRGARRSAPTARRHDAEKNCSTRRTRPSTSEAVGSSVLDPIAAAGRKRRAATAAHGLARRAGRAGRTQAAALRRGAATGGRDPLRAAGRRRGASLGVASP